MQESYKKDNIKHKKEMKKLRFSENRFSYSKFYPFEELLKKRIISIKS